MGHHEYEDFPHQHSSPMKSATAQRSAWKPVAAPQATRDSEMNDRYRLQTLPVSACRAPVSHENSFRDFAILALGENS